MQKKSRIIYLMRYLLENSDETNPVSSLEIMEYLMSKGFEVHRTTIQSDIAVLVESEVDIITVKSSPNKYFIGQRVLELVELKMLVDAVMSSKFITTKKSKALIEKLSKLTSVQLADELKREIYVHRVIKPQNETIYYTVDKIQQAINNKKWLKFTYFEYNQNKNLVHKHEGYVYRLCPYTTFWKDDRYYVVGYSAKHQNMTVFRVDRMDSPTICNEDSIPPPTEFDPSVYTNNIFEMFDGEPCVVELKCVNYLMDVIIDKFGEDIVVVSFNNTHFKVKVTVHISPRFYGWLFGFTGDISILSPTEVRNQYIKTAKKIIES